MIHDFFLLKKDDVLSQLSQCGHVYDTKCFGKLMHDCEFSHPFVNRTFLKATGKFKGELSFGCEREDESQPLIRSINAALTESLL
ncbi:hypothetical protein OSB04_017782 [Centaurea solstitialis]|uniref:Uncharacterized protein n=1 Tax=Centaurea solstitialis TaxID=347529 RepID=A0AA38TLL7_9ASTR|nr:hypothetical protein OSB04_017782 [Centaurea solstitialis]